MASPPLDTSNEEENPVWFQNVISGLQYEDHYVDVTDCDGKSPCAIHYQIFNPPSQQSQSPQHAHKCGVVLVHGGGAHSRWWDWTAPFLAKDGHVVACIDLSGQGDSGHRDEYAIGSNVLEVMAVARNLVTEHGASDSAFHKPTIIGHSFGGWVTMMCGRHFGEELGGIITLDALVRSPDDPSPRPKLGSRKPGTKSFEDLRKRFRLMPPQPERNRFLLDYIFPLSITQRDDLFVWKQDYQRFEKTAWGKKGKLLETNGDNVDVAETDAEKFERLRLEQSRRLRGITCRTTLFFGELSGMTKNTMDYVRQELEDHPPGNEPFTPIIEIPDAHHHVMFDQPIVTTTALRTVLMEWHRLDLMKHLSNGTGSSSSLETQTTKTSLRSKL